MSNLKIEEKFTVAAPVEQVWQFLLSPELVAGCLPGAALRGQEGADTYLGTMKIKVGPVTSEFRGKATMSDVDAVAHRLKLSGTGDDTSGGGSARMTMELSVTAAEPGSEVQVVADVEIAGKLVRFGRGMIEGVSKQLFKQFVERARERITAPPAGEPAPPTPTEAAPASEPKAEPVAAAATATEPDKKSQGVAPEESAPAPESPADAKPESKLDGAPAAAAEAKPEAKSPDSSTPGAATPPAAAPAEPKSTESAASPATGAGASEAAPAASKSESAPAAPAKATSESAPSASDKPASPRGPAPAPEPSDITTGVLPRPKPRPLSISVPQKEPEALDAGALVWRALWAWFLGLFRRLLGRGK